MKNRLLNRFIIPLIILQTLFAFGCEDVINVDLNSSNPQVVIEGVISDEDIPYTVKISKTTDYFNPGGYDKVSNASVLVSNDNGDSELL